MINRKLIDLKDLAVASYRRWGRLVMACGCFDLLHVGHVRHLQAARRLGEELVVLLTPDEHVAKDKGPGRPVFPAEVRAEMLAALECVDKVTINYGPDNAQATVDAIRLIRPDVYVKGIEYQFKEPPSLLDQKRAVEEQGGKYSYLDTEVTHTTEILRKLRQPEPSMEYPRMPPCTGWEGPNSTNRYEPCKLCGWPAEAHS